MNTSPPRTRATAAVVGLALVLALTRLATYDEPLERDITSAAVIGHELLAGRSLYADMWDHKPPAIHVSHALAILIVGYGPGAVYLLNVAAAIITLFGVYVAASAVGGITAGLWGAVFWTLVSGDVWLQANQPNAEAFINACVVWAFALLVGADGRPRVRRLLTIGALFALASLYKPVAAASAAFIGLVYVVTPPEGRSRRRALADVFVIGGVGVVAWLGTSAYFVARGHFTDFYQAVFAYNQFYSSRYTFDKNTLTSQNLIDILAKSVLPEALFPGVLLLAAPLAVFTLAGLVRGAVAGPRRPWLLLLGLAVGTHLAVALPGQWRPHYYQLWLPLLAVGAGWAVASAPASGSVPRWLPSAVASAAVVVLVIQQVPLYHIPADAWSRLKYGELFVFEQRLGRELRVLLGPSETLYEWGAEPGLYFESLHSPPSGAFYAYPLIDGPVALPLTMRALLDLERRPPIVFVVNRSFWFEGRLRHPVLEWAERRYVEMAGNGDHERFMVLVRRGSRLDVTTAR